ncbi:DUF4275 family protein [Metabacillus litoralis]|uniref:DUF4275 family protein n=1 Tax=Metabacillus litoralis TaxID=152268 RepID=UPI001CFE44EC|nr:DUF4275 family protein [Metabacillus litoralis]
MRYKELKVIELPKWGSYLRSLWSERFTSHLSVEERKTIYLDDGFLWHVCSWEKVKCLKKLDAIEVFNEQSKVKCTIFYQYIDEAYLLQNARTLTLEELPYDQTHMYYGDIYIMDWDKKWSFVMTHESECGPYFISEE